MSAPAPEKWFSPQGESWKSHISSAWADWAEERIAALEADLAAALPAGPLTERLAARPLRSTSRLVHKSGQVAFRALCGADVENQVTSQVLDSVTCRACLDLQTGRRRFFRAGRGMLGLFTCQRLQWTRTSCASIPGSPSLCAVCWFCQAAGLPVPTVDDLIRHYEAQR